MSETMMLGPNVSQKIAELAQRVLKVLRHHPEHPVTAIDLQNALEGGVHDVSNRSIRRAVRELNAVGYPVVSSAQGFRLAATWEEVSEYRLNLLMRARKIMERAALLETIMAEGYSTPMGGAHAG